MVFVIMDNLILSSKLVDVMDDIEYLEHSDYFSKYKDNIYSISDQYLSYISDTRSFKKKIEISSENIDIEIENTNDEIILYTTKLSSDLEEVNDMNVDETTRISRCSSSSSSCLEPYQRFRRRSMFRYRIRMFI